ncbi:glutathionylspermidine synthase family protein [Curtobacterium sp. VKM Ac-1376]|uniref:glutathionylspermidine synthase family protein n=1 Tax=Curtobacterium sp. VKM Ac-1376 TaxID=123312 RepID=UPI00188AF7C4|nr:glutathionylspermidine synthase family protein [Curtobacterium sp. VKM Ac-1376]MBF4615495.1 glutathionylspermidine synthase family protein [Curtobacterium sp. VKM Ac-1376]
MGNYPGGPGSSVWDAATGETPERVGPSNYPGLAARLAVADRERLLRAYENSLLPRPVYLDAQVVADLSSDIAVVAEVLLSLPGRLVDGDESRFARRLGVTEDRIELASIGKARTSRHVGRADVLRTENGFRMVEFNLSSALGGLDIAALNRAFLADEDVSRYVGVGKLGYVDPVRQLVAHIKDATDGAPGTVALVDTPTGFPKSRAHLELLAEILAQHGVEAVPTHLGELEIGSAVTIRGRRIHTVHRFFTLSELVADAPTVRWAGGVLRQLENTAVPIVSPLSASFFGSKRSLAALWESDTRSVLSPAEEAAVERLVPWSTPVPSESDSAAVRAAFVERCVEQQTRLVLKPAFGASGNGVVIGWETNRDDWINAITDIGGSAYVVQEAVRPVTEQFPTEEMNGHRGWRLNYGFFDLAGGFAGAYVRGLPASEGAVIGESAGASRGCIFIAGDDSRLQGVRRP